MKKQLLFTFIVCLLCGANFSAQTTYWVKSTGNDANDGLTEGNAFLTISAAYTAAATGDASTRDVINIVGTVAHGASVNINKHLDFKGISSGTIDASTSPSTDQVFVFGAKTINFEDLTITNSTTGGAIQGPVAAIWANATITYTNVTFSNNTSAHHAGALVLALGTHTFSGCTFSNNTSQYLGGAIFASSSATVNITNTTFTSNESIGLDGGAIAINTSAANFTITGCTFDGNSANNGGALFVKNSSLVESGSTFNGNNVSSNGGAVYIDAADVDLNSFTNSTFTSNTATTGSGGAIYDASTTTTSLTISGSSIFTSNSAQNGGAIYMAQTGLVESGSTFTTNTATTNGGAVYLAGGSTNTSSFTGSTFKTNSSTSTGGALYDGSATTTSMSITNSLFDGNSSSANGGGIHTIGTGLTVSGTTFVNNSSNDTGGAILVTGNGTNASSYTNVTFYDNKTDGLWAPNGAGLRIEGTGNRTHTFTNSLFIANYANAASTPLRPSDVWATNAQALIFNNCIVQTWEGNSIKNENDVNNGSTFAEDLSESSLSFVSPNVTFTAPTSISNATPIDFGTDGEDIGAWNSNITLFKSGSDWGTPANWSSGALPTATDNVTLLSDSPALVIGATTGAVANDLNVDAGSSLTVTGGGSLILSGTSSGNITHTRTITKDADDYNAWYSVASPVTGETVTNLRANHEFADGTAGSRIGLATYNNTTPGFSYFTTSSTDLIAPGTGLIAKLDNAEAGTDLSFTGTYTTGPVEPSISQGSNNFNFVGNPYSAYINLGTFFTDNNAANRLDEATIWIWDENKNGANDGGYVEKMSGTDGAFQIAPGQGFFVSSGNAGSNKVTFSSTNQQGYTAPTFLKTSRSEVLLNVSQDGLKRQAKVYYTDGATTDFDNGYDGSLFGGVSYKFAVYTELVANNQGKKISVQSLPNSDFESMIVPVGVKALAGKEIAFSVEALNLPSDIKVFLEDRANNTFTQLDEENAEYKVTLAEALNGTGRFYLHTTQSALSVSEDTLFGSVSIFKTDASTLRITGLSQGKASVKMFNILGKNVLETAFTTNGVQDISLPKLTTGIYIVQLETATGKLNKKITLE